MGEKGGEINDEASHHLRTRAPRSSGTCGGCCRGALGHDVSVQRDRGAVASGVGGGRNAPARALARELGQRRFSNFNRGFGARGFAGGSHGGGFGGGFPGGGG